jgi:hypothetical protein
MKLILMQIQTFSFNCYKEEWSIVNTNEEQSAFGGVLRAEIVYAENCESEWPK